MKRRNIASGSRPKPRKETGGERIVRTTSAELARIEDKSDWKRATALTDRQIDDAVAGDPHAAPILGQAFWRNAEILDPRHEKKTITMRVDDDVLDFFKDGGAGYQSRMNAVLRAYVYARRERVR